MVLRCVAVLEIEQLAGAICRNGCALVVRRRAHGAAAGAAGDVARAGKLDGHAARVNPCRGGSQVALPCNAYCVCTLSLAPLPGAEPAARRLPDPACRARAASPCSRACSSSPRKTPRQSARPSIRAGSSPQRSSCAGCSPASPIPSKPGHAPGRSPAGSRWRRHRARPCARASCRAGEWDGRTDQAPSDVRHRRSTHPDASDGRPGGGQERGGQACVLPVAF
jgi:hypothetical protein